MTENIPDADKVVLWYDPADAINHPDETKVARDAWRDGIVSSGYYRDKIGATAADAPTPEDLAIVLAILGNAPDPNLVPEGETEPAEGGTGNDANEAPPPTEDTPSGPNGNGNANPAAVAAAATTLRILGASELAVTRARSLAGSRLVSRSKGCEPCKDAIRDTPLYRVASALGLETVHEVIYGRSTEADLVAGAGEELAQTIAAWGVSEGWSAKIGERIEQHALRTLYEPEPPPLPAGFAAVVARALQ